MNAAPRTARAVGDDGITQVRESGGEPHAVQTLRGVGSNRTARSVGSAFAGAPLGGADGQGRVGHGGGKIPNTKLQIPEKHQIPMFKMRVGTIFED